MCGYAVAIMEIHTGTVNYELREFWYWSLSE